MDALHQLIRTLDSGEKRYFKLFASAFRESTNLTKLFDLLDVDQPPTESDLSHAGVKNLNVNRSNLRKLIFKAMRNYNTENSWRLELRNLISDAEFLESKQLYGEAEKELRKAMKVASEACDQSAMYELYLKMDDLPKTYRNKEALSTDTAETIHEFESLCTSVHDQGILRILEKRWARYNNSFDQNDIDSKTECFNLLFSSHLSSNIPDSDPIANLFRLGILSSFETAYGNKELGESYFREGLDLFDRFPALRNYYFSQYFSFSYNYATALYQLDRNEESYRLILEIKHQRNKVLSNYNMEYGRDRRLRHGYALLSGELRCILELQLFDQIDQLEMEFETMRKNMAYTPNQTTMALLYLRFASAKFQMDDCIGSLAHLNEGLKLPGLKSIYPISYAFLFAEAMCHLKLGKRELAESKLINLYKVILSNDIKAQLSRPIIQFIRKAAIWDFANAADRNSAIMSLKELEAENRYSFVNEFISPIRWLRNELGLRDQNSTQER
jgi:hypothetical protein